MVSVYSPTHGRTINVSGVEVSEDPDTQVDQVLSLMDRYSAVDGDTPELRGDALSAAQSAADPITGNFYDVKNKLRFVQDDATAAPFAGMFRGEIVETLVRPIDIRLMSQPQGDCDDFSMLMRARLLALGIPARFRVVAVDKDDPGRYSHVYVVADCSDGACGPAWDGDVPLDASHGPYPGWQCPNPYNKRADFPGVSGWAIAAGVAAVAFAAWWLLR